jgi:hypothetical protein
MYLRLLRLVNNELERIWKEAAVVLTKHLAAGTEEKYEKRQSGQPVSRPRLEPSTSRIQV